MPGRQGAEKGEKKGEGGGEIAVWQPGGRGDVITRLTGGSPPGTEEGGRHRKPERNRQTSVGEGEFKSAAQEQ